MSRENSAGIHKARQRKSEKQAEIPKLCLHGKAAAQKTLASANQKDKPLAFCNWNFRGLLDSKQNPQVHFCRLGDFGPSVIIGFQKTQIYQRFAGVSSSYSKYAKK